MNDLPTIEKLPANVPDGVTVHWNGTPGGTGPAQDSNTAGATFQVLDSLTCKVTPAGPTNAGVVKLSCMDGDGNLGRAQVIFLLTVTFS